MPIIVLAVRHSDENEKKKNKKKEKGPIRDISVKVANDIPTDDTLRLPIGYWIQIHT